MDIAKYITTAVILTSIFGEVENKWIIYIGGLLSVMITLSAGLWLVKDKKKGDKYGSIDDVWICFVDSGGRGDIFSFRGQENSS